MVMEVVEERKRNEKDKGWGRYKRIHLMIPGVTGASIHWPPVVTSIVVCIVPIVSNMRQFWLRDTLLGTIEDQAIVFSSHENIL